MELQISNTREDLLLNTISHFNVDNRGMIDRSAWPPGLGTVQIRTFLNQKTGNRCAIGRELMEDLAIKIAGLCDGSVYSYAVYDLLPERLKDMGADFLGAIQALHDLEENWDEKGLSDYGYDNAGNIIKKYNLDLKL